VQYIDYQSVLDAALKPYDNQGFTIVAVDGGGAILIHDNIVVNTFRGDETYITNIHRACESYMNRHSLEYTVPISRVFISGRN